MMQPPIRYVRNKDVAVAYQVVGDGPPDLLVIPGWISHLALDWEEPRWRRWCDLITSFARLIRFDKRGTGLSDRPPGVPTVEQRLEDIQAVLNAVGVKRAHVMAYSEGGPAAILFAARYPERVESLILYGTQACFHRTASYLWGFSKLDLRRFLERVQETWGDLAFAEFWAPQGDQEFARRWAAYQRAGASPSAAAALFEAAWRLDVRPYLGAVRVPTLVLARSGDRAVPVAAARYMAEQIPGARFREVEGEDHVLWAGDIEDLCREIQFFITGSRLRRRARWPGGLTDREIDVLKLLACGLTKKRIAKELFISPRTVHIHVVHIYEKAHISSKAEAALFAMEYGLVEYAPKELAQK